jgi:endonuclease-3
MKRSALKTKPARALDPEVFERVFRVLRMRYPDWKTELFYENPFQLLVAVILSAQCTDERVNKTTPALFRRFPTAEFLAKAKTSDVERLIHSCGFFRMKAKAIIGVAMQLMECFRGEVPRTIEELITLPGVGRKTASVVLNQAFGLPAIAVDTHVKRVSRRLGWAKSEDPQKIEFELRAAISERHWAQINGMLILHGRRVCKARKPLCMDCCVKNDCPYFRSESLTLGRMP